jgi:hypothetical protein
LTPIAWQAAYRFVVPIASAAFARNSESCVTSYPYASEHQISAWSGNPYVPSGGIQVQNGGREMFDVPTANSAHGPWPIRSHTRSEIIA